MFELMENVVVKKLKNLIVKIIFYDLIIVCGAYLERIVCPLFWLLNMVDNDELCQRLPTYQNT